MAAKLIVALDFDKERDVSRLIEQLDPKLCALKVGNELFTLLGPSFVRLLVKKQFKVFLDLKFHDIPNTVSKACKAAANLGVWMMTVHAAGGMNMMQSAREAIDTCGSDRPLLIAVTVLTSFSQQDLAASGVQIPLLDQVKKLAILAKDSGLDGVVSSAHEVPGIKMLCGSQFINVTPGIRLASDTQNDQKRVMTPGQAIAAGSDYLVVGRSITQSSNPAQQVADIIKNCSSAFLT